MNAILLIRPGTLRDGMDALLFSIPNIHLVTHSSDSNSALDFSRKNQTELIIVEIRPDSHELINNISKVKEMCPHGHLIALIHSEEERQLALQAEADLIISVGTRSSDLKLSIEELTRSSP